MKWRPMVADDLRRIGYMVAGTYPVGHPPRPTAFESRFDIGGPHFCFTLAEERNVHGYAVAHPWTADSAPPVHQVLRPPAQLATIFIHDVAIESLQRGRGLGREVVELLADAVRRTHYPSLSVVATADSEAFWAKQGFLFRAIDEKAFAGHGAGASYMVRDL